MRFIGNKKKLLNNIYQAVLDKNIKNGVFCDFFAGTSNVGRYFKQKGFKIISSDLLYFSYILQKAYIINNGEPKFTKLIKKVGHSKKRFFSSPFDSIRDYLDDLNGVKGFIYKNYTEEGTRDDIHVRKYFTAENGKHIDAIRQKIEEWKNNKVITTKEYFILLAALIESVPFYSNISGVYGAFLKQYDPRALKKLKIKPMQFYDGEKNHKVYNGDSMKLIGREKFDILYIDPPYNNRQYAPNYHILETIAKYDNPKIKGVSGMRDYENQKSDFCNKNNALLALEKIANTASYKYLILSYNSEGIMAKNDILDVLKKFGKVELRNIDYRRFKSNSNGKSKNKKLIQEQLYLLTGK